MENVVNDVIKLLQNDEKIIFKNEVKISLELPNKGKPFKPCIFYYDNTTIYISNIGNIYFYNEENNICYYFRQTEDLKRFDYYTENGKAYIDIEKLLVSPKKRGLIIQMGYITTTIAIPVEMLKLMMKSMMITLFTKKDESKYDINGDEILLGKNIFKIYGNNKEEFAALKGITVKIEEGDFTCIMGPSGSGKSTLINVLSTIDEPSRGLVLYRGKDLLKMSEKEISEFRYMNIGFIFQDFNLLDNLTIKENIAIPLILGNVPKVEILQRIDNISKKLYIVDILNKYPAQCSGGQNQRAACARALVSNPKIIIADEPTGNLDTKNSHELLKMLQSLNQEGITVVMVTHDNMIASYSKKVLFIRDGIVDDIIERNNLTQKEYFYKIIEATSKESQILIDIL